MPTIALNNPDPTVLDGRHIRAAAFEQAQEELLDLLQPELPAGRTGRALTVGAGYSRLPLLVAHRGFDVTAVDPSDEATAQAQAQAADSDASVSAFSNTAVSGTAVSGTAVSISAEVGQAVPLAHPDHSFDLVWCIDTLELATDPGAVLAELARVVTSDGVVVLDTLTDTFVSRLIYLRLFQQFPGTSIMPAGRYSRDRFLTPGRLRAAARLQGLELTTVLGYQPQSALALITGLLRRRRNTLSDDDLAAAAGFRLSKPGHKPVVTYYAVARPGTS